ncbi:hypothetical protein PhCBS80983_g02794 [Powellomyces hirtus]|uniref:Nucleoporin Nup54 alpha-helical domain-containing protein n=1 Tax=Powellomyces hirtus TaxID=109895 RepID=A0A507E6F5_9FUNG|nr:hypothetical protein PhCBS80983_g02794 [Powellomyces hirtus]
MFGAQPQQQQQTGFGGFGGFGTSQPQQGFGTSQPPQQQGGLFGAQAQSVAPSFGGFGATSQPPAGSAAPSLFGTATSKPGGLFGQPANTAAPGGSLFGSAPPAGGSLFGAAPASAAPGGGLFGASAAPGSNSLFGSAAPAGGSLFGAPAASTAPGGGLFGAPAAAPGSSFFGGQSMTGGFGQQQQQQQQQQASQQPQTLSEHLQWMASAWNPDDPRCQFKHYFYNIVHPSEVASYGPAPGEDISLYQQAQRDNPDPKCMVPVVAVGFRDIKKRVDMQEQAYEAHKAKLEEMRNKLVELQRTHFLDTSAKLEEYKRRQAALVAKVLRLMKHVQLIRNRGYSVRAEEEKFKIHLEAMERELQKPSVFRGRLNEIWAHLQQNKSSKQFSLTGGVDTSYNIADEQQLNLVFQTLAAHQNGLTVLTEVAQQDSKDTFDMLRSYEEAGFRRT